MDELESNTTTRFSDQKKKDFGIFSAVILIAFVLVGGSILTFNSTRQPIPKEIAKESETFIANGSIVYGYWRGKEAVISVLDLSVNTDKALAILPTNIKVVKILSGNSFAYIAETDVYDYGKKLNIHTIDPPGDQVIFEAESGFGIDDYMVSQNGQIAAVWTVQVPDTDSQLSGNKSKVFSVNLATRETNLIYDEVSTPSTPVHYPVGIRNSGEIYLDTFLPNSGAGWAYGMSVSDFTGAVKEDLESMKNGTYSTQPVMSPDGSLLAFAGYDGQDGADKIQTFRKALINPNTVETLSTIDKKRTKIDTKISNALYPLVVWDSATGRLLVSVTRNEIGVTSSQYAFNPLSQTMAKIEKATPDYPFFGYLQDQAMLFGQRFPTDSGLGNLGPSYSSGINKLELLDDNSVSPLTFDQLPVQLIAIKPSKYFPIVTEDKSVTGNKNAQKLQLLTFELKPTLAPIREYRQSSPVIPKENPPTVEPPLCATIVYPQCNALLGTNYPIGVALGDINPPDPAFSDCFWAQTAPLQAKNACADSPLYLYGEEGKSVNVQFGTEILNTDFEVLNNGLDLKLSGRGDIFSFDYISKRKKIERPEYGYIVKKIDLRSKLEYISNKFALNEKETEDVSEFGNTVKEPFVFVSFFDDEVSKSILPIYFDPRPDTYRNIVFYIEGLNEVPKDKPQPPFFSAIKRQGFTAIELSYIAR